MGADGAGGAALGWPRRRGRRIRRPHISGACGIIEQPERIEVARGRSSARRDARWVSWAVVRRSCSTPTSRTRLGIPVGARRLGHLSTWPGFMNHDQLGRALDDLAPPEAVHPRRGAALRRSTASLARVGRSRGCSSVLAERWPGYDPGESDLETRARSGDREGRASSLPKQQHRMRLAVASRCASTSRIPTSRSRSRSTRGSTTARFGHSSTAITSAGTSSCCCSGRLSRSRPRCPTSTWRRSTRTLLEHASAQRVD